MHAKRSAEFRHRNPANVWDFLPKQSLKLRGTPRAHRMTNGDDDWSIAAHTACDVLRELCDQISFANNTAALRNLSCGCNSDDRH